MREGCLVLAVGRVRATLKKIEIPPHKNKTHTASAKPPKTETRRPRATRNGLN